MDNPKNPQVATATPEEQAAMLDAQSKALEAQNKRIAQLEIDLQAAQEEKENNAGKPVVVKGSHPITINKKNYLVVHGLITAEGRLSVAKIAGNKELCAKLIERGSSAIVEA